MMATVQHVEPRIEKIEGFRVQIGMAGPVRRLTSL